MLNDDACVGHSAATVVGEMVVSLAAGSCYVASLLARYIKVVSVLK